MVALLLTGNAKPVDKQEHSEEYIKSITLSFLRRIEQEEEG
jgi:hypothetical protein